MAINQRRSRRCHYHLLRALLPPRPAAVSVPLVLVFRRRKVEIQRQPVSRLLRLRRPHLRHRQRARRPGPVPPHVASEGLARRKLRPAVGALVDPRRRQLPPAAVGGGAGGAAQLQRERRRSPLLRRRLEVVVEVGMQVQPRLLVVLRLLVAGSVATEGLERREDAVARLARVSAAAAACSGGDGGLDRFGIVLIVGGFINNNLLVEEVAAGEEDEAAGRVLLLRGGAVCRRRGGGGEAEAKAVVIVVVVVVDDGEGNGRMGPLSLGALALGHRGQIVIDNVARRRHHHFLHSLHRPPSPPPPSP